MKGQRHSQAEAMEKLREGQRMLDEGENVKDVVRRLEITPSTWNRWKNAYGSEAGEDVEEKPGEVRVTIERPERKKVEGNGQIELDHQTEPAEQVEQVAPENQVLLDRQVAPGELIAAQEHFEEDEQVDQVEHDAEGDSNQQTELDGKPEPKEQDDPDEPIEASVEANEDNPLHSSYLFGELLLESAEEPHDPPLEAVETGWGADLEDNLIETGMRVEIDFPLESDEWKRAAYASKPNEPIEASGRLRKHDELGYAEPMDWREQLASLNGGGTDSDAARTETIFPLSAYEMPHFNPLAPIKEHLLIVAFSILIFVGLGVLFASQLTPRFKASAGLVVEDARRSTLFVTARPTDAERYIADQIAVLTSRAVAETASELAPNLEPGAEVSIEDLLSDISVASDLRTDFLTITFVADDPTAAQVGANAIGTAYQEVVASQLAQDAANAVGELDEAINATISSVVDIQADLESTQGSGVSRQLLEDQMAAIVAELAAIRNQAVTTDEIRAKADQLAAELQARILLTEVQDSDRGVTLQIRRLEDALTLLSELTLRRSQLEVDAQLAGNGVALFSAAGSGVRVGGSLASILAVAVVLGGLVGAVGAYGLDWRTSRVRRATKGMFGIGKVGDIPRIDSKVFDVEMVVEAVPGSKAAEAFESLIEELGHQLKERQDLAAPSRGTIITIASPGFGEGKTVVAVNAALAASRAGFRALLIDADFLSQRATSVLSQFGSRSSVGLSEIVAGKAALNEALLPISLAGRYTIDLLQRGEGDLTWSRLLLSSSAIRAFEALRGRYDLIFVDTAPLLEVPLAAAAFERADYALAVIKHHELLENAEELLIRLNLMGIPTLGYVYVDPPKVKAS